ncbi:HET-domain-containing protein, partial [Trematosphaeria pertusa]
MNAQLRTLSKAIKSLDRTAEPKQQQHTEEVHQEASPYPSINASDGETRLIELLPGAFSDQINVRLSRATITGCTEYDALSYVWGQEISTTPALVNGIPVKITVNLEGALRHLRKETASRIIWIDALSISQHDVNERNRQVQNMGTIYASARQVIIWLGDGAGDSEQVKPAFDFMKTGVFPTKEDPFFDLRSAFYYIRSSEWFDRVWVIQELVLATEDPIVYHRHDFVSWS